MAALSRGGLDSEVQHLRLCRTVVFPEDADDAAEGDLRDREVRSRASGLIARSRVAASL